MKKDDAALRAVSVGGRLDGVDHVGKRILQAEDGIPAGGHGVLEEGVADERLAVLCVRFPAIRQDHVIHALERVSKNPGILADDFEIVLERAFPVEFLVVLAVQGLVDGPEQAVRKLVSHKASP
jgi:hypothetical protein